jgi:hypothetical protein
MTDSSKKINRMEKLETVKEILGTVLKKREPKEKKVNRMENCYQKGGKR